MRLVDAELLAIARFLSFTEVANIVLASHEAAEVLTLVHSSSETVGSSFMADRQLMVPVVEVRQESASMLRHASVRHIEVLCLWSRVAFEELKRILQEEGTHVFSGLQRFSAKCCNIGEPDLDALAPLIGSSRLLSLVNFERNQLCDGVVANSLVSALTTSPFDTLNLRLNMVSDDTAAAVAELIRKHETLSVVNFKNNRITDAGATELASSLPRNQVLRVLNLRRQHPGLTDASAKSLAAALRENDVLVRLLLRKNRISDEGCGALVDAVTSRFKRLSRRADSSSCNGFELDLEDNRVDIPGGLAVLRCLQAVGPDADMEMLFYGNKWLERDALRSALLEAGADPCEADDQRLRLETSKPEHVVRVEDRGKLLATVHRDNYEVCDSSGI